MSETTRFIVDPDDATRAIVAPSGRLAGQVYLVPSGSFDPGAPRASDLRDGSFIGFTDPDDLPFEKIYLRVDDDA